MSSDCSAQYHIDLRRDSVQQSDSPAALSVISQSERRLLFSLDAPQLRLSCGQIQTDEHLGKVDTQECTMVKALDCEWMVQPGVLGVQAHQCICSNKRDNVYLLLGCGHDYGHGSGYMEVQMAD